MRIIYVLTLCLNFIVANAWAQGRVIDVEACHNWERLEEINGKTCLLSADGNFVMFKTYSENIGGTTILKDIKSDAETTFHQTFSEYSFDRNTMFSFQVPGDSLVIFDTENDSYLYLVGVKMYFIIKSESTDIIAYFTGQSEKKALTIWDVARKRKLDVSGVYIDKYWCSKQGTRLLIMTVNGLMYVDLSAFQLTLLTSDKNIENAAISDSGNEVVYISHDKNGNELKYLNVATGTREILLNDSSEYLKNNWKLEISGLSFTKGDDNVLFKVSPVSKNYKDKQDSVMTNDVNVWSYRDLYLQPKQMSILSEQSAFTSVINIQSKKMFEMESEELSLSLTGNSDRYFVLTTRVNENEFYWNKQKKKMFLFSVETGDKILITESEHPGFRFISISPDNRFVVWFNGADGNYYSYNISSGTISNISRSIDGSFRFSKQRHEDAGVIHNANPYEGHYWVNSGRAIIVNSKNDIWQLDPLAIKAPINLTNGYGASNDIRFRLVDIDESLVEFDKKGFLAWAFDNRSKQNGFWKIGMGKTGDPVKLIMSDDAYFFYPLSTIVSSNAAGDPTMFKPMRAYGRNLFIVRRMNATMPPNLYSTTDLKNFKRLTNINPNKDYAGISTKLVKWKLHGGRQAEGILHRPGDYDSTKKYPIIFNYYEQRSECLNVYRTPELSGHNINIPWYLSRDYLIFEPDFYYKRGKTAKSVIESVESAVVELSKLPYIDQSKMGIQGQSHGGYETNILATGTHLFVAACEMAGFTNLISEYGSIRPGGYNNQSSVDVGQRNLGVFPWDHPEVFIENSPIFHVSKMTTPLLMVHNKEDGAVLFSQAIELYLSMRRLGKKVWLLQYDGEGHDLVEPNNKLDFTIRMQQFFDHYLKDAPMPIWMSKGIPASLKGLMSGLQYEMPFIEKGR